MCIRDSPCAVQLELDVSTYSRLYLYNTISSKWQFLNKMCIRDRGYTFASETDTEVLVKLIDSCYQGEPVFPNWKGLDDTLAMNHMYTFVGYAGQMCIRDRGTAVIQLKLQPLFALGEGDGGVDLAGGTLHVQMCIRDSCWAITRW